MFGLPGLGPKGLSGMSLSKTSKNEGSESNNVDDSVISSNEKNPLNPPWLKFIYFTFFIIDTWFSKKTFESKNNLIINFFVVYGKFML